MEKAIISTLTFFFLTLSTITPAAAQKYHENSIPTQSETVTDNIDSYIESLKNLAGYLSDQLDLLRSKQEEQKLLIAFSEALDLSADNVEEVLKFEKLELLSSHIEEFRNLLPSISDSKLQSRINAYLTLFEAYHAAHVELVDENTISSIFDKLENVDEYLYDNHKGDASSLYTMCRNYVFAVYQLESIFDMIDNNREIDDSNKYVQEVKSIPVLYEKYYIPYRNCNEKRRREELRSVMRQLYKDMSF